MYQPKFHLKWRFSKKHVCQSGLLQLASSQLSPLEFFPTPQLLLAPWGFGEKTWGRRSKLRKSGHALLFVAFSGFAGVWPLWHWRMFKTDFLEGVLIEAENPSGNIQWCVSWYRCQSLHFDLLAQLMGIPVNPSPIPTWGAPWAGTKMALCHLSLLHGPYLISQSQIWAWLFTYLCPTTDEYVANSLLAALLL